jgi:hypothetical protein
MTEDLITVRRFYTVNDAEMAKMLLEAEGISSFIADATLIAMDWFFGNAVGWVKLQVAAPDVDRAAQILAAMGPSEAPDTLSEPEDDSSCLQCGRPMPEGVATCPDCGWTYESPADVE